MAITTVIDRKLFFLLVGACVILPRMPFDDKYSIGGDLSRGFRTLLMAILVLNLSREILHDVLHETQLYYLMLGTEATLISFLSLLTPYLLRGWMSDRINFPGARLAGRGLNGWIYGVAFVNLLGVTGRVFLHSNDLWVFKKIGDMLTFFPVVQTLTLYNSITSAAARYPGRGIILSQMVLIGEYYCVLSHGADVVTKLASLVGLKSLFYNKEIYKAIYHNNGYAAFFRILCHGILLNVLDENSVVQQTSPQASAEDVGDEQGQSSQYRRDGGASRRAAGVGPVVEEIALM